MGLIYTHSFSSFLPNGGCLNCENDNTLCGKIKSAQQKAQFSLIISMFSYY